MIRYHGGPVTPIDAAVRLWSGRHALISFAAPGQAPLAFEVAQSVLLDNSAFGKWMEWLKAREKAGADSEPDWRPDLRLIDLPAYAAWVREWQRCPKFAGAFIPDDIAGDEAANDRLIARWLCHEHMSGGIPVWHLHESLDRLRYLVQCARGNVYPAVALGSSGQWATPGTAGWWQRMAEAMEAACDGDGYPRCRLHGLRMMDPDIVKHLPLASADSANVARNIGLDTRWTGAPMTKAMRAAVLADRLEHCPTAARWTRSRPQLSLELTT